MDGWNTIVSYWGPAYFSRCELLVFREGNTGAEWGVDSYPKIKVKHRRVPAQNQHQNPVRCFGDDWN